MPFLSDINLTAVLLRPNASSRNVIVPKAADVVPLTVRGAASQTADYFYIEDSESNEIFGFHADGSFQLYGHIFVSSGNNLTPDAVTIPPASGVMVLEDSGATPTTGFYAATAVSGVSKVKTITTSDLPSIAHSSLTGLTTGDDHTQYVKLSISNSSRNVITSTEYDGLTLVVRVPPISDIGGTALSITDNAATATHFRVGETTFGSGYVHANCNLYVSPTYNVYFASTPGALSGVEGYIRAASATAAAGYLNMSANSTRAGGYLNIAAGATGPGGYIDTSNDGGNIVTNGSGSIGLGTSGKRTSLAGSGSTVSIDLPAISGTLASLAGTQTFSGAKTFSNNNFKIGGASSGVGTVTYANSATSRTHTVPIGAANSTFILAQTTSTTAGQLCMATATAGAVAFATMSGDATITSGGVLSVASTIVKTTGAQTILAAKTIDNAVNLQFGSASQAIAFTQTGNDTLQIGLTAGAGIANSLALVSAGHLGNANRSPSTAHTDPTLYVYSADSTQANDYISINHDQTNANIKTGNGGVNFTFGAGAAPTVQLSSTGCLVYMDTSIESFGVYDPLYGDHTFRAGYDPLRAINDVLIQGVNLYMQSASMMYVYGTGQDCEFAGVYNLGGGDEFYVGPYNDDAAGVNGVKVNVRYARGNSVGSIIQIDGANQSLDITGLGLKFKRTATAISYTATAADYIIAVTSTASARTITLPAVSGTTGRVYVIKDESGGAATNNITIDGNASETIDGATTKVINTNYGTVTIYSNGSAWFTI